MRQLADNLPRRSWRVRKRARLWLREHHRGLRYAVIGLAIFAVGLEVVQLAYPSGRLLPFSTVQGQPVSGTAAQAQAQLDTRYSSASVTVKTDTKQFTVPLAEAGVRIDVKKSADAAAQYPLWQRLIPFSLLTVGVLRDTPMRTTYDDAKLAALATQVEREGRSDSVDASVEIKQGRLQLVPSTPTKEYPTTRVVASLKAAHFTPKTVVIVEPKTTAAELTDGEVNAQLADLQKIIDAEITFRLQGKDIKPDKQTRGSWLTFTADSDRNRLNMHVETDKAGKYLTSVQGDAYKAPGVTRIQRIDGREVSRTAGANGRGVDTVKAASEIDRAFRTAGDDTIELYVGDLPPTIAYDDKHSNSDPGLASLVSGIAAAKGGYGISLMEIDGRSANANGDKQFIAASTYKLYVAYAVFQEVKAGRLSWSDMIGARTVAKCFDDMIIVSDNDCPKALGNRIGWSNVTAMMRDMGLSSATRLGSAMYTTTNDLSYFLYRIQNSSIVSSADRDRLINAMKRQSYTRAGIPAGASGVVADKVGDVDGYLHDAAIIYGSKKTYVLVVMSYGGSWAGIADVARQISDAIDK